MSKITIWTTVFLLMTALAATSCREQSREENLAEASKLVSAGNTKGAALIYKTLLESQPDDAQTRLELAKAYLDMGKPDQTEREVHHLAAQPNPPAGLQLLLGKALLGQGKIKDALATFSGYLEKTNDSAEGWEFLGHAYALDKAFDKATETYRHALAIDPGRTQARISLVEMLLVQNQLEAARNQVDSILKTDPNNHAGLYLLAQVQARNKDIPAAIATFDTIAAQYPQDTRAKYSAAALLLASQGLSDKVEQTAKSLIQEFPTQYEGYKLRGLVNLTRGEASQALSDFQQSLRLHPDLETHYFMAQAYTDTGNVETAISELHFLLNARPDQIQARQLLAKLQLQLNRPDEAIAELEKLLQYHPEDSPGKLMLGDLYLFKHNPEKSIELFNEIKGDTPLGARAHLMKGLSLATTGKTKEAEVEWLEAVVQDPTNLEYRMALVALYRQQQRPDDALTVLERDGLSPSDQANACITQADIRLLQDRLDDTIALLEKAKSLAPDQIVPYRSLAAIYFQKLEPDKALEQYRQAIANQPQSSVAHRLYAAGLERVGKFDEARQEYELGIQSKQPEAYLDFAGFLARRDKKTEALQLLKQCAQEQGNDLPLLVSLARLQAAVGDEAASLDTIKHIESLDPPLGISEKLRLELAKKQWNQADATATKLIELKPTDGSSFLPLASAKMQRGDLQGAEQVLRQALSTDKANATVNLTLGSLLFKMGRTQDAFNIFNDMIAKRQNLAETYAARGMAWQLNGNTEAATKDYEAALHLQNRMPMVLNNLAMLYVDDPTLAAKGLSYALAANTLVANNPLLLDTLGYALLKNGKKEDAASVLRMAAVLEPNNAEIAKHLHMATSPKE